MDFFMGKVSKARQNPDRNSLSTNKTLLKYISKRLRRCDSDFRLRLRWWWKEAITTKSCNQKAKTERSGKIKIPTNIKKRNRERKQSHLNFKPFSGRLQIERGYIKFSSNSAYLLISFCNLYHQTSFSSQSHLGQLCLFIFSSANSWPGFFNISETPSGFLKSPWNSIWGFLNFGFWVLGVGYWGFFSPWRPQQRSCWRRSRT